MMASLSFFVAVVLLLVWYVTVHRYNAISTYRDRLFAIRRELFLLAAESKNLPFDGDVYRGLEILINVNIRFAHQVSFIKMKLFGIVWRRFGARPRKNDLISNLPRGIHGLPKPERAKVQELCDRMDVETARLLARISPGFFLYTVLPFPIVLIKVRRREQNRHYLDVWEWRSKRVGKGIETHAARMCPA